MNDPVEKLLTLNRAQLELLYEAGFLLPAADTEAICDSLEHTRKLLLQLQARRAPAD